MVTLPPISGRAGVPPDRERHAIIPGDAVLPHGQDLRQLLQLAVAGQMEIEPALLGNGDSQGPRRQQQRHRAGRRDELVVPGRDLPIELKLPRGRRQGELQIERRQLRGGAAQAP